MRTDHFLRTIQGKCDGPCEIAANTLFIFSGNKKSGRWQLGGQNTDVVGVTCDIRLYYAY